MVLFTNVSKVYPNGTVALKDVNFFIDKGEFVFLVGTSGAGKSTITKLMTREEEPTVGTITVNNTDIKKIKNREMPYFRREMGQVFQNFRLLNNKTVFENVAFALRVIGASKKDIKRKVPIMLELVGLMGKENCRANELSGGEQQRIGLARALINNPPILLCDEPTGNLDPATSMEIMEILEKINEFGTTVIVVTHACDIVNTMKKRVIEIDGGCIVRDQRKGAYAR